MKRISLPRLSVVSVTLLLAACASEPPQRVQRRPGFNPPPRRVVVEEQEEPVDHGSAETTRTETESHVVERRAEPEPATADASQQKPPAGGYEYGKPVPGKPGFVTSPYAPYAGYVDVSGFMSGDQVQDPFTKRIFLVP